MATAALIISYLLILMIIEKGEVFTQKIFYDFKAIFLTICYFYLISNTFPLNSIDKSRTAGIYVAICFTFFLIMFLCISTKRTLDYNLRILRTFNDILEKLTEERYINFYFCLFLLFISKSLLTRNGNIYVDSVAFRLNSSGLQEYLSGFVDSLLISAPLPLLIMGAVRYKKTFKIVIILLLSGTYALFISRSFLINVIFGIYYCSYKWKTYKMRPFQIVVYFAIALIFINGITHIRGQADFLTTLVLFIKLIRGNGSLFLNVFGTGEFFYPANSIVRVIEHDLQMDPLLLLKDFSTIFPKNILPSRGLPPSEEAMRLLYPNLYYSGHGYGFSNVAVGYWWLGYLGVVVYAGICGLFFRVVNIVVKKDNLVSIFIFITIFERLFDFARGTTVLGFIKNDIILGYLPTVIGIMFFLILFNTWDLIRKSYNANMCSG